MANKNFDKVYEYIRENSIWDNIDMEIAEDEDENVYIIVYSSSDIDKLSKVAMQVLCEDSEDFDIESELDIEVVFSDEYTTCSDCNKIIRTSPTSYHWQPDFYVGDGYIICNNCFNNNEDYQESYINDKINDYKKAVNGLITEKKLVELGFKKINDNSYENGLHYGQNDNPEKIYNKLNSYFDEILFMVESVGQFDLQFSVWGRGEV